jgi:hypothetical protein
MRFSMLLLAAVIVCAGVSPYTVSQTPVAQRPSIEGRAFEPGGSPAPGVSVTTTLASGGASRHATTGTDGTFRFDHVPDGTYRVDFELPGFQLVRRNHVRVAGNTTADVEAALQPRGICECIQIVPTSLLPERAGQEVDQAGRPLPHARVTLATPRLSEVAYADADGRFRVRVPTGEMWSLTASDSGFNAVTLQVSATVKSFFVFALRYAGAAGIPAIERLKLKQRLSWRSIHPRSTVKRLLVVT